MKKLFTKYLSICMLAALCITVISIFSIQTFADQRSNTDSSYEKLESLKEKLQSNDVEIQQLTDALSENALAKTRAFAYAIKQEPGIIEDKAALLQLCQLLAVDELHVIDKAGIITHSTVDAYIGFDMASGEQTLPFLEIINDPTLEIAQEPQPNATEGTLFQYIGVARMDAPGLVQVGIRPEVLEEMLSGTSVKNVFAGDSFGDTGYVFAIDTATGLLLAHPNEALIGTDAAAAGFSVTPGTGKIQVEGVTGYYVSEEYQDMIIGTMLPASEYYSVRFSQTLVVSISMLIIFILLLLAINRFVNVKIVIGIQHFINDLQKIREGNLDLLVEVDGNPEFQQLSSSINQMVGSIRENMEENQELLEQQKQDVAHTNALIAEVRVVCENLEQISNMTLNGATNIHNGTQEQKVELEKLNTIMEKLAAQIQASAETSSQISNSTEASVQKMMTAKEDMLLLLQNIQEISTTSVKIESIIDEIASIATQTNMLSLNASIEAARAGELGKGFAVVATQVGELAARSANAVKETTGLINNTLQVISKGQGIADTVVNEFMNVVEDIAKEKENIMQIAEAANVQVHAVLEASEGLQNIAQVVENNVQISQDSQQTSESLAEEMKRLADIV